MNQLILIHPVVIQVKRASDKAVSTVPDPSATRDAGRLPVLEERLRELSGAPPGESRVAQFLSSSLLDLPFLSAQAIADQTGVSKATVVRTARRLGYSSFGSLREAARRLLLASPSSPLERARLQEGSGPWALTVDKYQARVQENLRATFTRIRWDAFEELAGELIRARRVFVYGLRYSHALAYHLWLRLAPLLPQVQLVHGFGGTAADTVVSSGPKDYAILLAHQRVGREKELLASFLSRRNCPYSTVTDLHPSRISRSSRHVFLVATKGVGAFNSYVATLVMVELMALSVEQRLGRVEQALARAEEAWAQLDLFLEQ